MSFLRLRLNETTFTFSARLPCLRVHVLTGPVYQPRCPQVVAHRCRILRPRLWPLHTALNIYQFNWPDVSLRYQISAELRRCMMHAQIQTSGIAIRKTTYRPIRGVSENELERSASLLRKLSASGPRCIQNLAYLPPEIKLPSPPAQQEDRAALQVHRYGLQWCRTPYGEKIGALKSTGRRGAGANAHQSAESIS